MTDAPEIYQLMPKLVIVDSIELELSTSIIEYENWLNTIFGEEELLDVLANCNFKFNNDSHKRLIWGLLNLFLYFLRILRIPIFDFHYVEINKKVSEATSSLYECSVAILKIDFYPEIFELIFKKAISLNNYISTNSCNEQNIKFVFSQIQSQLIQRLQQKIPGGKSTFPVLEVAKNKNIPFLHLGKGIYQLGFGSKKHIFDRSYSEFNSTYGTILAQSKFATTNYIKAAGFPTPNNVLVSNFREARQAASSLGFPVVVKPIDRDRGEGVSININTEDDLNNAFIRAIKLSRAKRVLVEEMIPGVCHRLFIANQKLLYAVKRLPTGVYGDGVSTIYQLVQNEIKIEDGKAPWKRKVIAPFDKLALDTISRLGFQEDSVPDLGVFVPLRLIESTIDGGVDIDMTTLVNIENLKAAMEISKLFNLSEVGIDFITNDISVPWYENGGVFNEINVAPLLGGGEISRGYISNFIQNYFTDNGQIKIVIEKNFEKAHKQYLTLINTGLRAYLTSEKITLDVFGNELFSACENLENKIKAILYRPDCDALVICKESN